MRKYKFLIAFGLTLLASFLSVKSGHPVTIPESLILLYVITLRIDKDEDLK